ncbi:hypothetical protein K505DRAFT_415061 [Melanomma pulvis-pyrius CBS 109.77]|uniref:Cora-domain-containing protein n=1 Tax=Melanomma pulvis-pyrius CBS 109.77 TaxID=1314802 RepID=A0A6A6XM88_9PLEO|nr:hypothetical protein K505DRAFT_415061 [Melanomma pulvis-pyrius CBS 109.77]
MWRLADDPQPLREFRNRAAAIEATRIAKGSHRLFSEYSEKKSVCVIDWDQSEPNGTVPGEVINIAGLAALPIPQVRILFAPRDTPIPERVFTLAELFTRYDVPSAFIAEGLNHVSQSFGIRVDSNGTEYVWFHFLCKDVEVSKDSGPRRIVDPANTFQDQANFTWTKSGFVLKIEDQSNNVPTQSHPSTNNSESSITLASGGKQVTLLCFGAPASLYSHLKRLKEIMSSNDLKSDPYILLDIVLEEMYMLMDNVGWVIGDIFGEIETRTLGNVSKLGIIGKEINFTGLHNLAKHTIYLRENCESALATLEGLYAHHTRVFGEHPTAQPGATRRSLEYRKTMFQSTQRRLESLDKRMTNILQLSFHLVAQRDSQSMKTIAVMTLIFMPLGTVAAIFGTQLIKLKDEEPYHMVLSRDFWLIWAIAVPLTILVVFIWRVWYRDAKARVIERSTGFEGWNNLMKRFERTPNGKNKEEHIA